MGITQKEKDYWLRELDSELEKQQEEYAAEVEHAMAIAEVLTIEESGVAGELEAMDRKLAEVNELYRVYEEANDELQDMVEDTNKKLKPFRYSQERYGQLNWYSAKVDYSPPSSAYQKTGVGDIKNSWIETFAEMKLDEVLASEGLTGTLTIGAKRKGLKRNVMLATTSAQLRTFLEAFCSENGLEL